LLSYTRSRLFGDIRYVYAYSTAIIKVIHQQMECWWH